MSPTLKLLAASLALSLGLGEICARLVLPRPGFTPFPIQETRGVVQPDPERGYAYTANYSRHVVTPDYEIDFRTNSLGMRDVEPDRVDPGALHLLAVGDSYTQGHGVEAEEAWPKRLEARLPGSHVYNTGVSGYGLQQMRRSAEVFFERFAPRAIFVGVYGHGYSRIEDPYVMVGDGAGLVTRSAADEIDVLEDGFLFPSFHTNPLRAASFWIDRHWFLGGHLMHLVFGPRVPDAPPQPPWESPGRAVLEREMQPMLRELAALHADAERWGTPLVALLVSPAESDGSFAPLQRGYNEVITAFAREQAICWVDPIPSFVASGAGQSLRLGVDKHWSPRAQDIAAEQIVSVLRASLSAPSPETLPCQAAARAVLNR